MAKTSYVPSPARIKVIGLGGGGCNAITRMVREQIRGVEFIAMNTDAQALTITEAAIRIQLGERLTRGLGAGGDHLVGRDLPRAILEHVGEIARRVDRGDDGVRELLANRAGLGLGHGALSNFTTLSVSTCRPRDTAAPRWWPRPEYSCPQACPL